MHSTPENFFQFEKLLAELAQSGVDFAVVGGIAISLNGYVRATDDADIIVAEAPDNIRRVLKCLEGWGEGWARELKEEDFVPQEGSIRVMEDFDLDILLRQHNLWVLFLHKPHSEPVISGLSNLFATANVWSPVPPEAAKLPSSRRASGGDELRASSSRRRRSLRVTDSPACCWEASFSPTDSAIEPISLPVCVASHSTISGLDCAIWK